MTVLNKKRGNTLLVALVMLMLLTLIALSAMYASTTSIEVVGNAQLREEANAAAQLAIERVISTDFTISPASAASSVNIPVGGTEYTAEVAVPTCINSLPVGRSDPDRYTVGDEDCFINSAVVTQTTFTASGVTSTPTYSCNRQTWEVTARATDSNSGADTTVHQGVSRLVRAGTDCP
jgi:type II secretory pathway pseudopilin PulG